MYLNVVSSTDYFTIPIWKNLGVLENVFFVKQRHLKPLKVKGSQEGQVTGSSKQLIIVNQKRKCLSKKYLNVAKTSLRNFRVFFLVCALRTTSKIH
jgi:hypothetical protein